MLPSVAPVARRDAAGVSTEQLIAHHSSAPISAGHQHVAPVLPAEKKIDQRQLRGALDELLSQQGRLPPACGAAFDARLTPAWPGLQLPV